MDITENSGEGQFNALQLELQRRFKGGLAVNAAYTLAGSDSNAPDSGNSTIGVVQYDPYDIEKDRGPDPNVVKHRVVMNSTWEIPFGRERPFGSESAAVGRRDRRRLDRGHDFPGAQRTEPDAVFHLRRHRRHLSRQHRAHARRRRPVRRSVASRRHRAIQTAAAIARSSTI